MLRFFSHIRNVVKFNQLPREQRRLVVYSEGKNYWVHLDRLVQGLLDKSDIPICYVSSSSDDPGLKIDHPNYRAFVIDEGFVRDWFFANIDTDIMVMTMPDLHQYQVKRSKNKVHYAYVQHSLVSFHMVYREGAFDYFDSIFCAGPHHLKEIRAMVDKYNLSKKVLFEHGYARLDSIIDEARARPKKEKAANAPIHVLVAPSWGPNGIIESGEGGPIVDQLLAHGFKVTLRPHPQTTKFAKEKVNAIVEKHKKNSLFEGEGNVAGQDSIQESDIMICDWSGVAFDYAFGMEKPVLFIDVPRKVNNPNYLDLGIEPFEAHMRKSIGDVVSMDELDSLSRKIEQVLENQQSGKLSLSELRESNVFNVGRSGVVGAEQLLTVLNPEANKVI